MSPCTSTFQSYTLSVSCIERESALLSLSFASSVQFNPYSVVGDPIGTRLGAPPPMHPLAVADGGTLGYRKSAKPKPEALGLT
jgi:hypothetical protein